VLGSLGGGSRTLVFSLDLFRVDDRRFRVRSSAKRQGFTAKALLAKLNRTAAPALAGLGLVRFCSGSGL